MRVKTLLKKKKSSNVITAKLSTTIDSAMQMLISNNIGCLPITDDNEKLIGIVSDTDIFRKVHETKGNYHELKVADVMTTELIIGLPEDNLSYIAGIMDKNYVRHVPIVEGEKIVGLVSLRDIFQTQAKNREIENRYLKLYLDGLSRRDKSGDI